MLESTSYDYRLRQFQKAYCSSLDWKTAVKQLHAAVIQFSRQAAIETNRCNVYLLETWALQVLNLLLSFLEGSRAQNKADVEVCDQLMMIYHSCSLHLICGRYHETIQILQSLFGTRTVNGEEK